LLFVGLAAAPVAASAGRDGAGIAVPAAFGSAGPAGVARAAAVGPDVTTMIVGPRGTLFGPATVNAAATAVAVGGKRCRVAAGTVLAVLSAAYGAGGPAFSLRDYGDCSLDPADSGQLFVTAVGGFANRGADGWEYKVDERAGTTGAGDPSGAFGNGQGLRGGNRVLWFWCSMTASGDCQRTLVLGVSSSRVAPGARVTVTVTGDDNEGRGVAVRGAIVTVGSARASTNARGQVALAVPRSAGSASITAQAAGLVPAFPQVIDVT
jgi:hypothetical protein